jgi:aryl-alcohol dehydrogenase-like predicted oxidoreductase
MPGTSSEDYLEQNVAAAGIQPSDKEHDELGSR